MFTWYKLFAVEIDEVELLHEIFVMLQQNGPHDTPVIDGATLRTVLRKSFNMSDAAMMDRSTVKSSIYLHSGDVFLMLLQKYVILVVYHAKRSTLFPTNDALRIRGHVVVQAFTPTTTFDAHCDWEEFVRGMSVFLRGTLEERTDCK